MAMGFKRAGNLLHEALALEYVKRFLLSLPVVGAHHYKSFARPPSYLDRLMAANHLFYNTFQVVSEFVCADCVHKATFVYGNAVQLYTKSPNRAKHSDSFFVAPLAPWTCTTLTDSKSLPMDFPK